MRPGRVEPPGGPVERAEEGAGHDGRVAGAQNSGTDAAGDERADAALVAVALGDDGRAQPRGQRVHLEVRGRSLDLVEQAPDVGAGEGAQPGVERGVAAAGVGERGEQPVERAVLAEVQNLVLAPEVVVQVPGREVGGLGDVAHAGVGESAGAEDPRGGPEDRDAPLVGAAAGAVGAGPAAHRTTVR